jgi:hypothetical protein
MRHASVAFAAAVSCLAGVLAIGSAKADVFDFSFGPGVSGTFTTGAAASDPGYELITGLTFDLLSGKTSSGVDFSFTDVVGSGFQPGAAFNPTTDAFINHFGGGAFNDIGGFAILVDDGIDGSSFSQGSGLLSGIVRSLSPPEFVIPAPLEITAVPEASTWAMMLAGFAGLGLGARRLRRSAVSAA